MVQQVMDHYDCIDVLVNNAGIMILGESFLNSIRIVIRLNFTQNVTRLILVSIFEGNPMVCILA